MLRVLGGRQEKEDVEDIRKRDHNILLLPEGRNTSQTCKPWFNTEKSKQPCLAFNIFYQASQFWFSRASSGSDWQGWKGQSRREGSVCLMKERLQCPGCPAPGHRSSAPASAQQPFQLQNTYKATVNQRLRLAASSHGHRERSLSGLEALLAAGDSPAPLLTSPAGHRPLQDTAPQPRAAPAPPPSPRRAHSRRSSPRTHGPRQPRAPLSAPLAAAAGASRALPLPGHPGPAGIWSSRRGCALRTEPLSGRCRRELRGAPAVPGALLRSGRTAKAAPWRGEQGSGRKSWRYLPFASCSPQPRGVCPWPALSPPLVGLCGAEPPGAPVAPVLGDSEAAVKFIVRRKEPRPLAQCRGRRAGGELGTAACAQRRPAPPGARPGLPGQGTRLILEMPDPPSPERGAPRTELAGASGKGVCHLGKIIQFKREFLVYEKNNSRSVRLFLSKHSQWDDALCNCTEFLNLEVLYTQPEINIFKSVIPPEFIMFLSLFTCLDAMLLHAYIEDVISLSVEVNRSAECLLFRVPLKGLFYYFVQFYFSSWWLLYFCWFCLQNSSIENQWLVRKHSVDIRDANERKANSLINLEKAFENGSLIHLNRQHAGFGITNYEL